MDKGLQINFSDHPKYVVEWKEQERKIYRRLIVDFTLQMFQRGRKAVFCGQRKVILLQM